MSSRKTDIEGEIAYKKDEGGGGGRELGQFADLRGAWQERGEDGCFWGGGGWYLDAHYDCLPALPALPALNVHFTVCSFHRLRATNYSESISLEDSKQKI